MWIKDLLDVSGKELRKTVSDVGVLVFFIVVPLHICMVGRLCERFP